MKRRRKGRLLKALCVLVVTGLWMMLGAPYVAQAETTLQIETGEDGKEYYLIYTKEDLFAFAEMVNGGTTDINAKLKNDIVVNENLLERFTIDEEKGTAELNSGETDPTVWTPIGGSKSLKEFAGIFDGQGYAVSGLYFDGTDPNDTCQNIGLIGKLASGGTVRNVTVKDSWIKGCKYVGGVAGYSYGTIENCRNKSYVVVQSEQAGGIVGCNIGTITNCRNSGCILGSGNYSEKLGGITGYNGGRITNCRNEGMVQGKYSHIGGIAGYQERNAIGIRGCCNSGAILGESYVGGIVGANRRSAGSGLEGCYNIGTVTATDAEDVGGVAGDGYDYDVSYCGYLEDSAATDFYGSSKKMTEEQFKSGEAAFYLNGEKSDPEGMEYFWYQTIGEDDYPVLGNVEDADNKVVYRYLTCLSTEEAPHYGYSNEQKSDGSHLFENGSSFCQTCKQTCGIEFGHTWDEAGTTCEVCGFFCQHGNKTYDNDASDKVFHTVTCATDGCNWTGSEPHSGGVPTCSEPGTCEKCNSPYMDALGHVFVYSSSNEAGTGIVGCSQCNETLGSISLQQPDDLTYDGTQKAATINIQENSTDSLKELPKPEITYDADPVDVGTYTATSTLGDGNGATSITCTFSIQPKQLTLTKLVQDYYAFSKMYDGTPDIDKNEIEDIKFEGVVEGDEVTLELSYVKVCTDSANAGSYTQVTVTGMTLEGDDKANYTLAESYTIDIVTSVGNTKEWAINPRPLSIEVQDQSVELNGSLKQEAWELSEGSSLVEGHKISSITLVGDTSKVNNFATVDVQENSVKIVDTEGNDVTGNYEIYALSGNLTVKGCESCTSVDNGFCTICGSYEAPTLVTEENYNALGLTEEYIGAYAIKNAGQLFWFAEYINHVTNEKNAVLLEDITVPADAPEWAPIIDFYGTFDGNYKKVSRLVVNQPEKDYIGFFGGGGYSYGTIKNLMLTNSKFTGNSYVGGIAGYHAGTIENCGVVAVEVNGTSGTGMLLGYNAGTVNNCFAYGESLVGTTTAGYATVENCFYLAESADSDDGYDGTTAKTAAQFASGEVAYLLQAGIAGETVYDEETGETITVEPEHIWGQQLTTDAYPVFGGAKVYQVTCVGATCYSNTNENYNEHSMSNGTCTRCGSSAVVFSGGALSLGDRIAVHFYMTIADDAVLSSDTAYMQFTLADGTTRKVFVKDAASSGNMRIFTCNMKIKEMTDVIKAKLVTETYTSEEFTYSVKTYADKAVANSSAYGETTIALIEAMLHLGAYAQTYFDYHTENLANAGIAAADFSSATADNLKDYATSDVALAEYGTFAGISLTLDSRITLNVHFKPETDADISALVFTANGNSVAPEWDEASSSYVLKLNNLKASELDEMYEFTVAEKEAESTNTVTYATAVLSYCHNVLAGNYDEKLVNVVKALYLYNQTANAYVAQ